MGFFFTGDLEKVEELELMQWKRMGWIFFLIIFFYWLIKFFFLWWLGVVDGIPFFGLFLFFACWPCFLFLLLCFAVSFFCLFVCFN
jgi:hypothetical protein